MPIRLIFLVSGTPLDYWDSEDISLEMSDHPNIWTEGSREDFSSLAGFEVAGLVFIYLLLKLLLILRSGVLQKRMVTLVWSVAVLFCRFLVSCKLCNVLNSGVLLLLCTLIALSSWY